MKRDVLVPVRAFPTAAEALAECNSLGLAAEYRCILGKYVVFVPANNHTAELSMRFLAANPGMFSA